jgi:hypothetical protein
VSTEAISTCCGSLDLPSSSVGEYATPPRVVSPLASGIGGRLATMHVVSSEEATLTRSTALFVFVSRELPTFGKDHRRTTRRNVGLLTGPFQCPRSQEALHSAASCHRFHKHPCRTDLS